MKKIYLALLILSFRLVHAQCSPAEPAATPCRPHQHQSRIHAARKHCRHCQALRTTSGSMNIANNTDVKKLFSDLRLQEIQNRSVFGVPDVCKIQGQISITLFSFLSIVL